MRSKHDTINRRVKCSSLCKP